MITMPAMAADQFDLVCTSARSEARYRLDLERAEWCEGSCDRVLPIKSVTAGLITFYDDQPSPPHFERKYKTVNRISGEWRWYFGDRSITAAMDVRGVCRPSDFSGFPKTKF
jgi:hypothetical protein